MRQFNILWLSLSINFLIAGLMEYHYHPSPVVLSQTPAIFILKCDNMKHTLQDVINKMPAGSKLTPAGSFKHFGKRRKILFRCICGNEKYIDISSAISGGTLSCGCAKKDAGGSTRFVRIFEPQIRELYDKWKNMISRCYDPKNIGYCDYGKRGVRVCEEWKNDYQKFLDWALINGWEQGLHLDKDIKGNGMLYSPNTCSFVTPQVNYRARRHIRKIIFEDKVIDVVDLEKRFNITDSMVRRRVKKGMSLLEAIITPKGQ